jgi:ABC-type nitrate/sulfonate/bicarbonate transport system substrate-binding protein
MKKSLSLISAGIATSFLFGCSNPDQVLEKSGLTPEQAMATVKANLDVSSLVMNDYIPGPDEVFPDPDGAPVELTPLRVGLSWVANDQVAPWFVGQEKGFFAAEGVEVIIVEGGPGRDHLVNLVGGKIDVFIGAPEPVLQLTMSPTGADVVMLGATLKGSSAGWVTLDRSIPNDQRSTKKITADDIRGKRVGLQGGAEFYGQFVCDRLGIRPDEFTLLTAGATPDALITGAMDYFQCWIVNQPRILERSGYKNWVAVTFNDLGYESYMDISVVKRDTLESMGAAYRGYMRALTRSMYYLLEHPDESAAIVEKSLDPVYELSVDDIQWRFEREFPLYRGDGSEPIMKMDVGKLERLTALLVEYGQIEMQPLP